MAGGNPLRQKMINMMYLVLTALLALNVSADILKAFGLVNRSLGNTNTSLTAKNDFIMQQFQKIKANQGDKAEPYFGNAQKAQKLSNDLYTYLEKIKDDLAKGAEGWDEEQYGKEKVTVNKQSDLEVGQRYFIEDGKGKRGKELRDKLIQYNAEMKALGLEQDAIDAKSLQPEYKEKDGTKKKWSEYYFEGKPVIAAITLITKFQTDVKSAETDAIQANIKRVGAEDFKFDRLMAMVSVNSPSLNVGGKFEAKIALGAYDTKSSPTVIVGGRQLPVVDGNAIYTETASGVGQRNITGTILVKGPKGEEKYPFSTSYQVFTGGATISAEKMNMLYVGIDNPISIAVSGFRPDQVNATATKGSLVKKGPGQYNIKPASIADREITINVSVNDNGTTRNMGSQKYRVRNVPKPELLLGSKPAGPISRGELGVVSQIYAGYGEAFPYDLPITVTGFTFIHAKKAGGTPTQEVVSGNRVSPTMRAAFASARPGDVIVISEVTTQSVGLTKKSNGGTWIVK